MTGRRMALGLAAMVSAGAFGWTCADAASTPYAKPGLWALTQTTSAGRKPIELKVCVDAATTRLLVDRAGATERSQCASHTTRVEGSSVISDSVCNLGPTTITSHSVVVYTGDSAFHGETNSKLSPPFMGRSASHATQDGRWIGACPAGMAPGDMTGPGGVRMPLVGRSE